MPTIIDTQPGHDDFVRRSRIVNGLPERFEEPMAWYDVQLNQNQSAKAKMLTPVIEGCNQVDIVVELEKVRQPIAFRTSGVNTVRSSHHG